MKYEIIHDVIARQVSEKISSEARLRREIERDIRKAHQAYQTRGSQLSQEDYDYFRPYLDLVRIKEEERTFLEQEGQRLEQIRRRRNLIIGGIIVFLALIILTIGGLYRQSQSNLAEVKRLHEKDSLNAVSLASKNDSILSALDEVARQKVLAEQERTRATEAAEMAIIEEAKAKRQAQIARIAQREAEYQDSIAQVRAAEALVARAQALKSDSISQEEAKRAQVAAIEAKLKAKEARAAALAAQSRQYFSEDHTLALNLAMAAYQLDPKGASREALSQVLSATHTRFYSNTYFHGADLSTVTYLPDARKVMTAGGGKMKVWEEQGKLVSEWSSPANHKIQLADATPNGSFFLTGSRLDENAALWDAEGKLLSLFSAEYLGDLYRYKKEPGTGRFSPVAVRSTVSTVKLSPDGQIALVAYNRGMVRLWSTQPPYDLLAEISLPELMSEAKAGAYPGQRDILAEFIQGGRKVVLGSRFRPNLRIYHIERGEERKIPIRKVKLPGSKDHYESQAQAISATSDGDHVAILYTDNAVAIFDEEGEGQGEWLSELDPPNPTSPYVLDEKPGAKLNLALGDGGRLFATGDNLGRVVVRTLADGKQGSILQVKGTLVDLHYISKGSRLLIATDEGKAIRPDCLVKYCWLFGKNISLISMSLSEWSLLYLTTAFALS